MFPRINGTEQIICFARRAFNSPLYSIGLLIESAYKYHKLQNRKHIFMSETKLTARRPLKVAATTCFSGMIDLI